MHDFAPFLPWLGALPAIVGLVIAFRDGRRRRLIDNLPTSKTSGVFIGFVELKGTAESGNPLKRLLLETNDFERAPVKVDWTPSATP